MHSRSRRCAAASLIAGLALMLTAWGGNLERTGRDSIIYARDYIAELQKEHPEIDTKKAVAAIAEVVGALNVYCGGPPYESGGKCDKAKAAAVRKATGEILKQRIANLADAIAELEAKH